MAQEQDGSAGAQDALPSSSSLSDTPFEIILHGDFAQESHAVLLLKPPMRTVRSLMPGIAAKQVCSMP